MERKDSLALSADGALSLGVEGDGSRVMYSTEEAGTET